MSMISDMANHIISVNLATQGSIFLYVTPSFVELDNEDSANNLNVIYSVNISSGLDNPKWARGRAFVNFRVRGRSVSYIKQAGDDAQAIYDELLGHESLQIGNMVYSQFNSSEMPRFSGYYEGSEPEFSFTLSIVSESLVDIGNRLTY